MESDYKGGLHLLIVAFVGLYTNLKVGISKWWDNEKNVKFVMLMLKVEKEENVKT